MKKEQINELFAIFENACYDLSGVECWSARELQKILGYSKWQNFEGVILKASKSCKNAGNEVENHFTGISKMVELGSGAQRQVKDVALTRYACYLIAQSGDPAKQEIAFAQTYFAVQTRKQEIIEKQLLDVARVAARGKLTKSEKKLSQVIQSRGVGSSSYAYIRSEGDRALFGGHTTEAMKEKLGVPANRPLADFLSTLLIKAKDFATELTSHNVVEQDLNGDAAIKKEHVTNNQHIRDLLKKRNVIPEELPPGEDAKKVKRRLDSTNKKALKGDKK